MAVSIVGLTFESPYEPGNMAKALKVTADGLGVMFRCPVSGRDFVVSFETLAAQPDPKTVQAVNPTAPGA